jgi:hypothetical protein
MNQSQHDELLAGVALTLVVLFCLAVLRLA